MAGSGAKGRRRGFHAERELVQKLWKMGFAVVRGPASGAKIKSSVYPDVVAIKDGKVFVFEVKERKDVASIYVDRKQIEKIREFAIRAGGEALIAVKVASTKNWRVINIDNLVDFNRSKFKIPKNVIESAEDLFNYLAKKITKSIDNYITK